MKKKLMKKANILYIANTSDTIVTLIPKGNYPSELERARDSIFVKAETFKLLDPSCFSFGYGFIDLDDYYLQFEESKEHIPVDDCETYGIQMESNFVEIKKG